MNKKQLEKTRKVLDSLVNALNAWVEIADAEDLRKSDDIALRQGCLAIRRLDREIAKL